MKNHLLLVAALLFLFSCKRKEQVVSKEEAAAFAKKIDSAIVIVKKPQAFNQMIDEKALADKIAASMKVRESAELQKEIGKALVTADLGDKIIRATMSNGSYELVKRYEKENKQHLLFRIFSDQGLNYHDFELGKYDNKVVISDVYIYIAGDNFSSLVASFASAAQKAKGVEGVEMQRQLAEMQEIKKLSEMKKYEQAAEKFERLSPAIREQKLNQTLAITIYSQMDSASYMKAMMDYERLFPNDPTLPLLLIDADFLRENYGDAMKHINKLDQLIDKDPFLDYYRALIERMMQHPEESKKYFEAVAKNCPQFANGQLELLIIELDENEFQKAHRIVDNYRANKKLDQSMLTSILSRYPSFESDAIE